jgi:murein DD-endopeptidase MepM/ murein hydrolase activator NlpD
VISALTIQVIICVLLIVAFVTYKQVDEGGYHALKAEYTEMTTDPGGLEGAATALGNGISAISGFFGSIGDYFQNLVGGWFGGREAVPEDAPPQLILEDEPESFDEPEDYNEPIDQVEPKPPEPKPSFDYDYLGRADEVSAEDEDSGLGAGGSFPIAGGGAAASVPAGITLAPVILKTKMKPPVTGLITSVFGYRDHPLTDEEDFHNGFDIAAEEGRIIVAALPGAVREVGISDIYGLYIVLSHGDGIETLYAHCSELLAERGDAVRRGQAIARVGGTGVTTGPHLHFSVMLNGDYADPAWVLAENIKERR